MNRNVGFFIQFWHSLWDFKFFRNFVRFTVGKAFKYFFIFILLFALVSSIFATRNLIIKGEIWGRGFKESFPDFRLKLSNGTLVTDLPEPFVLGDKDGELVIDTTGQITELPFEEKGLLNWFDVQIPWFFTILFLIWLGLGIWFFRPHRLSNEK